LRRIDAKLNAGDMHAHHLAKDGQTSLLHDGMDGPQGIAEHLSSSSGKFLQ
jgi:uncharacterized protein with PIN domain